MTVTVKRLKTGGYRIEKGNTVYILFNTGKGFFNWVLVNRTEGGKEYFTHKKYAVASLK